VVKWLSGRLKYRKPAVPVLTADLSTTVELCNPTKIATVGVLKKTRVVAFTHELLL